MWHCENPSRRLKSASDVIGSLSLDYECYTSDWHAEPTLKHWSIIIKVNIIHFLSAELTGPEGSKGPGLGTKGLAELLR